MEKFKLYKEQYYIIVWSIKNNESNNSLKQINRRIMFISNFGVCSSKRSRFTKE